MPSNDNLFSLALITSVSSNTAFLVYFFPLKFLSFLLGLCTSALQDYRSKVISSLTSLISGTQSALLQFQKPLFVQQHFSSLHLQPQALCSCSPWDKVINLFRIAWEMASIVVGKSYQPMQRQG